MSVDIAPITGIRVRFPPGRVAVRLGDEHRSAYRRLYAHYGTVLDGLPVLRDRDFDGRKVLITPPELEALNRAFASEPQAALAGTFASQEQSRRRLFKRLQYLS